MSKSGGKVEVKFFASKTGKGTTEKLSMRSISGPGIIKLLGIKEGEEGERLRGRLHKIRGAPTSPQFLTLETPPPLRLASLFVDSSIILMCGPDGFVKHVRKELKKDGSMKNIMIW